MNRREFLAGTAALAVNKALDRPSSQAPLDSAPADVTLHIAPARLELAPNKFVHTTAYNGSAPGPLIRWPEGKSITIDVFNDTDSAELTHWHGLWIPSEVDGAMEDSAMVDSVMVDDG